MAYTDFLNILKMTTGSNSNTWGDETNKNWDRVAASISGYAELTVTTSHISTVTPYDLTTDEGEVPSSTEGSGDGYYKVIFFKGSPSARSYIQIGPTDKANYFLIVNGTGQTLRIYQSGISTTSASITTVSDEAQAIVTASSHGFDNGDSVFIQGVGGDGTVAGIVNNKYFTVSDKDSNTFKIKDSGGSYVDTSSGGDDGTGGTATGEPAVYVDVLNGFSSVILAAGSGTGLSGSNTNGVFRILDDMEFDFIKTESGIVAGNIANDRVPYTGTLSGHTGGLTSSANLTFTGGNTLTAANLAVGSGGATVTQIDNGALGSSATKLATQGAIKTYVDAQVTAQDLDIVSDSGTIDIDLDSESLTVSGGEGIDTSATGTTLTIAGEDASTSNKGVAKFNTANFAVSSGDVTIKSGGVDLTDEVTGTLPVANGGTNATSLSDKAVLITQDTGTDTVSAAVMDANGELLIGGTSGPAVGTITGDDGITVTNGDGTIEIDLDLKANGGCIIDSNELAIDLSASNITGTLANSDLANSAVTVGSTSISLGASATTIAGLASITSTEIGAFKAAGPINFDSQDMTNVDIDSGTIDGTVIGGGTPAAVTGTTVTGTSLDINGNADISGDLTLSAGEDGALNFSVASSVKIADNQAAALVIEEADNAYLTFKTSNSSEAVVLGKKLEAGSVEIEGSAFDINGGAIDDTTIGSGTPSSGAFTTVTTSGTATFGTDGSGVDVTFHSATAGDSMLWDASDEKLVITGTNGATSLEVADGNVTVADRLTATEIGGFTAKGSIDFDNQDMTNVDIDSGDISGVTISGGLTWSAAQNLNSQNLTNVNIDSGDISAATISGGLTWSAAQDLNNQNLTNVDIDSGTIDGVTIGDQAPGGSNNVAVGASALDSATSGAANNVAVGSSAATGLNNDASDNNVAIGYSAGSTMSGSGAIANTVVGASAGQMAGEGNVAVGYQALSNVGAATGQGDDGNTAVGYKAMGDCNNGTNYNVAVGSEANFGGQGASAANGSVAIGRKALYVEQTHSTAPNVAVGMEAGLEVGSGGGNVFVGNTAGRNSVSGISSNVAIGNKALLGKSDGTFEGDQNVAVGGNTLENVEGASDSNTCVGYNSGNAVTTGEKNVFLGQSAGRYTTTGSNNIFLGFQAGYNSTSTVSDKLIINNSVSAAPLTDAFIYGNMDSGNQTLYLNADSSSSNDTTLSITNHSTSYAGNMFQLFSKRDGNETSYYFTTMTNQTGGTNDVFTVRGDGQTTADSTVLTGGDYAEYFEWSDGNPNNEDRIGLSVVLDGVGMCRVATSSDDAEDIFGVVSATANTVGDSAWNYWHDKFQRDDFGRILTEDVQYVSWKEETEVRIDDDGDDSGVGALDKKSILREYKVSEAPSEIPSDAVYETRQVNILNPSFNPDLEYVPRSERKEWEIVGLMGKVRLRKGSPVNPSWKKMKDISSVVELWLVR